MKRFKIDILERARKLLKDDTRFDAYVTAVAKIPNDPSYGDLDPREKDFAFRYATAPYKPYRYWAMYYNVSWNTIQIMMNKPRVRSLIAEIRFNVYKYAALAYTHLGREALEQYQRIFDYPETDMNLGAKRLSARDILFMMLIDKDKRGENGKGKSLFEQLAASESAAEVDDRIDGALGQSASVDDLQAELDRLRETKELNAQVSRYSKDHSLPAVVADAAEES